MAASRRPSGMFIRGLQYYTFLKFCPGPNGERWILKINTFLLQAKCLKMCHFLAFVFKVYRKYYYDPTQFFSFKKPCGYQKMQKIAMISKLLIKVSKSAFMKSYAQTTDKILRVSSFRLF